MHLQEATASTRAPSRLGAAIDAPVTFLVGAERSGTTLLRLMLDGHPMLAFRYEFELAVDLVGDDGTFPDVGEFLEMLRTFRWVDPPPPLDPRLDYASLVRSILEHKRQRDRKPLVGATVHRHFDRLLYVWPDARFVHLVRDPRDVARSCVEMGWAGNAWTGVREWIAVERLWDRMCATLPASRRHEVRYEDLVRDPTAALRGICRFLRIPYDPEMLGYPSRSTYRPPDPALREQWRTTMRARDVARVEHRVGELLVARGYSPSGIRVREPSSLERLALRAHCRLGRARYAARQLGVPLWISRAVVERVGPAAFRDRVRMRINDVINATLR